MGEWLRGQTEHGIMAVRGKPVVTLTNQSTLLHAPVRGHSEKPVEFYDLGRERSAPPRATATCSRATGHNDNWDCHGDEAPPPGNAWREMWSKPFDFTALDDMPEFARRGAP